jgi:hypothetical protein
LALFISSSESSQMKYRLENVFKVDNRYKLSGFYRSECSDCGLLCCDTV